MICCFNKGLVLYILYSQRIFKDIYSSLHCVPKLYGSTNCLLYCIATILPKWGFHCSMTFYYEYKKRKSDEDLRLIAT